MSCRSRRRNGRTGRYDLKGQAEDVNPMTYITNLADAMLVLAMGFMIALVVHWNVDLTGDSSTEDAENSDQIVEFDSSELEDQNQLPENASHAGEVYYDQETDTYYIVSEDAQQQR